MRDTRASFPGRLTTDRPSTSAAPDPAFASTADEQRAKAWARLILKRAGIAPLVPVLAALLFIALPEDTNAEADAALPNSVRATATATATARATILPSSVRLEQGGVQIVDAGSRGRPLAPQVRPSIRPCDAAARPEAPACRMIVYDLP